MKNQSPLGRKTFKGFLLLSGFNSELPHGLFLWGQVPPGQPWLRIKVSAPSLCRADFNTVLPSLIHSPPASTGTPLSPPTPSHPPAGHSTLPSSLLPDGIHPPSTAAPRPLQASAAPQQSCFALLLEEERLGKSSTPELQRGVLPPGRVAEDVTHWQESRG